MQMQMRMQIMQTSLVQLVYCPCIAFGSVDLSSQISFCGFPTHVFEFEFEKFNTTCKSWHVLPDTTSHLNLAYQKVCKVFA